MRVICRARTQLESDQCRRSVAARRHTRLQRRTTGRCQSGVVQRVAVVGAGGSGKSTLARKLGDVTGLPVVHLDELAFRPGWVAVPKDEWKATQAGLVAEPTWIIDGNRESTMPIRLARADTVVFLDYSRLVSTYRALKRQLLNRGRSMQAEGCPERFDAAFIRWVWRYNRESRPTTLALIRQHAPHANLIVLKKPREAEALLARLARVRRSS